MPDVRAACTQQPAGGQPARGGRMTASSAGFIRLDGRDTCLILELREARAPLWRYWGPKLDGAPPDFALADMRPLPSFSLDTDVALSVFPLLAEGWFSQSALLAHRPGESWAYVIDRCRIERPGAHAARIVMADSLARISVTIELALDPETDVLSSSTELQNQGDASLSVHWLAASTLPLPQDAETVEFFSGRYQAEFLRQSQQLTRSLWRRENRRGLTSHDAPPTGFVTTRQGLYFGAHLAWSGNSVQQIEWLDDGRYLWQFGEWFAPGEIALLPGERLRTPDLLATCSAEGENGVAQNFHEALRRRIDWPGGRMRPRPVQINTWEGFYFRHDETGMKHLAEAAAQIGIERFVLDDGWFRGRQDDAAGLGDWTADPDKYPAGLRPLADYVVRHGMEFGLWVEPEMVNEDSELARAHPEWILARPGRAHITGRNQLVLDTSRADVRDYLFGALAELLTNLPVSYLKWDHNREIVASGVQATYRSRVAGTYALLDRLRRAFPHVEIESCAAGGGRIDAGILQYTHRFWTSDSLDAVQRVGIQRGFLSVFPPEVMGAHVGASPAHGSRRSQSLDFRAGVALSGHFGVELDLLKLSPGDAAALAGWIALYKALRDRMHRGRIWLGEAGDGLVWQAHGDAAGLLLLLYRLEPTRQRHMPQIRLEMLDRRLEYRVQSVRLAEGTRGSPFLEALAAGARISGAWLAAHGFPAPASPAESVSIFDIRPADS